MSIEYHRNMLADKPRNDAFFRALQKTIVKEKTTVADIGSGTGLLGFLASRLGAKDVYLYEHAPVMALAQKLAKDNKIKNCHFIHAHSTEIENPPKVDLIVSETLGNFAFEEQVIETIEDAKRFLKPGGTIIPQSITHFIVPVVSDRFYKELRVWDNVGFGLDYSRAMKMSLNNIFVRTFKAADLLDAGRTAKAWDTVDFREENMPNRHGKAEWKATKAYTCYGLAMWWKAELAAGVTLSTDPLSPKTHWEQLYFPLETPVTVKAGDTLRTEITSTSSYEAGINLRWKISVRNKTQTMDLEKGFLG